MKSVFGIGIGIGIAIEIGKRKAVAKPNPIATLILIPTGLEAAVLAIVG